MSTSEKIYIVPIITLAICAGWFVLILPETYITGDLPASKTILALVNAFTMLIFYGGLGYIGLRCAKKIGFPEIWDQSVTNQQRFVTPLHLGVTVGLFFIICDKIFADLHGLGPFPHPPFPSSILASINAGIGEELIFRLFFISFWMWLVWFVIFKQKHKEPVFWTIATISALAFGIGHTPAVMTSMGLSSFDQIPSALIAEMMLLNGVLSLAAAWLFWKFGLLAAIGIHFWTDIVWHVIYGFLLQ